MFWITNILVRAGAKSKGPAKELLRLIVNSPEHVLLISPFILMELERICSYPRVRTATRLSDDEVMEYLGYLCSRHVSEAVFPGPAPAVVPSDADDDPVVHTAVVHTTVVGRADVLCTLNRHFYHPSVLAYCNQRGVTIGSDVEILRLVRRPQQPPV